MELLKEVVAGMFSRKGFIFLLVLSGYYIKFSSNRIFNIFSALFGLSMAAVICFINLLGIHQKTEHIPLPILWVNFCEYLLNVLLSFYNADFLPKFFIDLEIFDRLTRFNQNKHKLLVPYVFVFVVTTLFVAFDFIFFFKLHEEFDHFTLSVIIALDIGKLFGITILELILQRMKYLKWKVNNVVKDAQLDKAAKIKKIKESMEAYILLLSILEEADTPLKIKMFLSLMTSFITNLINVKTTWGLVFINQWLFAVVTINSTQSVLKPLISCLLTELIAREIDIIKLDIIREFASSTDKQDRKDLLDTLELLDQNPLQRTMCRVFPLDITLVIGFLTTLANFYIIVAQYQKLI